MTCRHGHPQDASTIYIRPNDGAILCRLCRAAKPHNTVAFHWPKGVPLPTRAEALERCRNLSYEDCVSLLDGLGNV